MTLTPAHDERPVAPRRLALTPWLAMAVLAAFLVPTVGHASWASRITKKYAGDAVAAARTMDEIAPGNRGRMLSDPDLRRAVPDIDLGAIAPHTRQLVERAAHFASRGPFEAGLLDAAEEPLEVLRQANRYGDGYIQALRTVSQGLERHAAELARPPSVGGLDERVRRTALEEAAEGRFAAGLIDGVRRTGRRGGEAVANLAAASGRWAADHPSWTAVMAALVWFKADPEGFPRP
jgi:hypothetical protein